MGTPHLGLWYPKSNTCSLLGNSDVNFSSSRTDRKSTIEAEYIAVNSCCAQLLWMKQQLLDYGLVYHQIPILCDNTSVINLTKNPVMHSKTKHIQIHHHFVRDHVQRDNISLRFI